MLRIRIGESWKQNPRYLSALKALAEGRSKGFSPRDIVDVLGIELDGVDVSEGLGEAALVDALGSLVRAARALAAGSDTERVAFTGGRLELTLQRSGDDVQVRLHKPLASGVLCTHDFTLSPKALLGAVNAAARRFVADLERIHPALPEQRAVRALSVETKRPPRKRPAPRALAPEFLSTAPVGDGKLALRGDRSALVYLAADEQVAWTLPGGDALAELAEAIFASGPLPSGVRRNELFSSLRFGRTEPVAETAVREAVARLCEGAGVAIPAPPAPVAPSEPAPLTPFPIPRRRARPADLPTDGLRRLLLKPAWRVDAAQPRPRLVACREGVILRTHGQSELRRIDGSLGWRSSAGDASIVMVGTREIVAARDSHGALLALSAATGERLARVPAVLHGQLRCTHALTGDRVAANDGGRVVALSLSGGRPWTFEPPRERGLVTAAAPDVLIVGSDRGELWGLAADGRVSWHTMSGLDLVDSLRLDVPRGLLLATGLDKDGRASVCARELTTGAERWRTSLDGVRPGSPTLSRGKLCLAFESSHGAAVAALDVATGAVRWRAAPPGEGSAPLTLAGDRLLVARGGGGLVAYGLTGTRIYHQLARDPDPALSPARSRPALVEGGLAVVPAAFIHVYDAATGRPVASVEPADLAPESVALLPGPTLIAASRDGLVEAWKSSGHLRVVV